MGRRGSHELQLYSEHHDELVCRTREIGWNVWTCILERSLANASRVTLGVFRDVGKGRVNGCRHSGKVTHAGTEEGRGLGRLPSSEFSLPDCY